MTRIGGRAPVLSCPAVIERQTYRLRAPASGREAIAEADPDGVYVDHLTGEELRVVGRTLPLAPSDSALLRTPENLRICHRCGQLIGKDVNGCVANCPFADIRQPPLDEKR
jgi:hypothetical protein